MSSYFPSCYLRIHWNSHKHTDFFLSFFKEGGRRGGYRNQFSSLMFRVLTRVSITNYHEVIINNVTAASASEILFYLSLVFTYFGPEIVEVYFAS